MAATYPLTPSPPPLCWLRPHPELWCTCADHGFGGHPRNQAGAVQEDCRHGHAVMLRPRLQCTSRECVCVRVLSVCVKTGCRPPWQPENDSMAAECSAVVLGRTVSSAECSAGLSAQLVSHCLRPGQPLKSMLFMLACWSTTGSMLFMLACWSTTGSMLFMLASWSTTDSMLFMLACWSNRPTSYSQQVCTPPEDHPPRHPGSIPPLPHPPPHPLTAGAEHAALPTYPPPPPSCPTPPHPPCRCRVCL